METQREPSPEVDHMEEDVQYEDVVDAPRPRPRPRNERGRASGGYQGRSFHGRGRGRNNRGRQNNYKGPRNLPPRILRQLNMN